MHAFSFNVYSIFAGGGAYKGTANDEECELIAFEKALDYAELARFATVLFFSDSLN